MHMLLVITDEDEVTFSFGSHPSEGLSCFLSGVANISSINSFRLDSLSVSNAIESMTNGKVDWGIYPIGQLKTSLSDELYRSGGELHSALDFYTTPSDVFPSGRVNFSENHSWAILRCDDDPRALHLSLFSPADHQFGLSAWIDCFRNLKSSGRGRVVIIANFDPIRFDGSLSPAPTAAEFLEGGMPLLSDDLAVQYRC